MTMETSTQAMIKLEAHIKGECKPCAYFHQKVDGCRWGDDCSFCHLCDKDALKQRKRMKKQQMQQVRKLNELKEEQCTVKSEDETTAASDQDLDERDQWNTLGGSNLASPKLKATLQQFGLPCPSPLDFPVVNQPEPVSNMLFRPPPGLEAPPSSRSPAAGQYPLLPPGLPAYSAMMSF
eukprot:TRINITY_DN8357_c0_g2_i1.p2 TRINITY_DN8357_c0_g2~~TRINITY_DN8357_c0_g2_i1.p2  ORF type:complete len:179 (-),score=46.83 TRINITY_DN8357_c0_g2_i1:193-729(-)